MCTLDLAAYARNGEGRSVRSGVRQYSITCLGMPSRLPWYNIGIIVSIRRSPLCARCWLIGHRATRELGEERETAVPVSRTHLTVTKVKLLYHAAAISSAERNLPSTQFEVGISSYACILLLRGVFCTCFHSYPYNQ